MRALALLLALMTPASAQQIFSLEFSPEAVLGFAFGFPDTNGACPQGSYNGSPPCPQVDYAIYPPGYNLTGRGTFSVVFTIIAENAVFNHVTQPDGNEAGGDNFVHAFFQQAGDNFSGQGAFAYYRWWSNIPMALPDGTYTTTFVMNTPLQPQYWGSVFGENGANSPAATAGFEGAMANIQYIGVTFGGGFFAGHGLNMTSGHATFILNGILAQ